MRITTKPGKSSKVHIYADGEYAMSVDEAFWLSLSISEGAELDDEQFEQLMQAIGERRAFNKGAELLTFREHSRFELVQKLSLKGYAPYAQAAADRLCEYGYIDDERFAELYAKELSERKKMGERRIVDELRRRGVSREIAQQAVSQLEADPIEQITGLLNGKLNRYTSDDKGIKKCYNTLIRLGYSTSDIRRAMEEMGENNGE